MSNHTKFRIFEISRMTQIREGRRPTPIDTAPDDDNSMSRYLMKETWTGSLPESLPLGESRLIKSYDTRRSTGSCDLHQLSRQAKPSACRSSNRWTSRGSESSQTYTGYDCFHWLSLNFIVISARRSILLPFPRLTQPYKFPYIITT